MFIFVHKDLIDIIRLYENSNIPKLPSLINLIDFCNQDLNYKKSNYKEQEIQNQLSNTNKQFNGLINYLLKVFKMPHSNRDLEDATEIWIGIRKQVLENPTISDDNFFKFNKFQYLYINMNKNSYQCYKKSDFEGIHIDKITSELTLIEISEEAAMLDLVRNCKELEGCIKKNNIATSFKYNNLLIPIVFNNIYKGVLGETIGKYIVENHCNIKLEELNRSKDEPYESFDFKNEEYGVYFDFKYYSQNSLIQKRKTVVDKVRKKLEQNRLKNALIINIFANVVGDVEIVEDENLLIIPYLVNRTDKNEPFIDKKMIIKIKEYLNENK